ncbi:MAG: DUF2306 domain-containing protein, partial [Moraxellaceae bacterium]
STMVAAYAFSHYWIYMGATDGLAVKFRSLNSIFVYSHLIGGGFALVLGATQLFTRKGSRWHRSIGIGYCVSVVVGGIGGGYLSFFADQKLAGLGFFSLDVIWLYSTFLAFRYARARQIELHRRWIIRSLALTAAAISLRLLLPLLMQIWSFEVSYLMVAWLSWTGNLLLAEIYLHATSRSTTLTKGNTSQ